MSFVVAIVDDDHRLLESMESLLESAGYAVRLFSSAEAFLEDCGVAEIDCLISDISMSSMSGVELRRVAHETRPDLPVIFVTGCDLTEQAIAELRSDHGVFRKPFGGPELLAAVENALLARAQGDESTGRS